MPDLRRIQFCFQIANLSLQEMKIANLVLGCNEFNSLASVGMSWVSLSCFGQCPLDMLMLELRLLGNRLPTFHFVDRCAQFCK